jgi:hypothetical protein
MASPIDFNQKAKEAEELAASCRHPLLRVSLLLAAKDFRLWAQEQGAATLFGLPTQTVNPSPTRPNGEQQPE